MMPPWGGRQNGTPRNRGPGGRPPGRRAGLGLLYLAIGRAEAFDEFGNTPDAYLASLAPLVAFALVAGIVTAASGAVHVAVLGSLVSLCTILAPAVISHPLCRRWGREAIWPRYANILNWGQMLMFMVIPLATVVGRILGLSGMSAKTVLVAMLLAVLAYDIWLQWFVARGVVQVGKGRTVLLVVAVMIGTNLLVSVPLLLTGGSIQTLVK